MNCSSCVGKITAAEEKAWVKSASVGLLTQSASVDFWGKQNVEELATAINNLGYEATIQGVEKLPSAEGPGPHGKHLWTASYSVEGMTCISCVGTIMKALENFAWIKSVDVNLVTNSATVVLQDEGLADVIVKGIEDVGYGAKLVNVHMIGGEESQNGRKSVSIHIDGLYCQHCPGRVADALKHFGDLVVVEGPATLGEPIITITYTPSSPEFTIRNIISVITTADPAFSPAIHHPPTVEERTAQMHARIRRRIFYRVLRFCYPRRSHLLHRRRLHDSCATNICQPPVPDGAASRSLSCRVGAIHPGDAGISFRG